MTAEQIKNYLEKYRIDSEGSLAKHIEELKRNTVPNKDIIFPLVDMLVNEKVVLNSFFAENKKIKNPMEYLDEILEKKEPQTLKDWNSTSTNSRHIFFTTLEKELASDKDLHLNTRHKSKVGETHSRDIQNRLDLAKYFKDSALGTVKKEQQVIKEWESGNEKIGEKRNKNKPQISLLFKQFPKALEAVVKCSEYGHSKYKNTDTDYLNFSRVEGGSKTYADSGLRHRLEQGNDLESGLPHQFHVAWNALAELQLWIQENE